MKYNYTLWSIDCFTRGFAFCVRSRAFNYCTFFCLVCFSFFVVSADPPASWTPPKIDDIMTQLTVNEGEKVELPCVASSNPLPKYRWSVSNKELVIDSVSRIQRAGNLVIVDAKVTDSGVYMCNASNSHGSATGTTQLTVQCKLITFIDQFNALFGISNASMLRCPMRHQWIIKYMKFKMDPAFMPVNITYFCRSPFRNYWPTATKSRLKPIGDFQLYGFRSSNQISFLDERWIQNFT